MIDPEIYDLMAGEDGEIGKLDIDLRNHIGGADSSHEGYVKHEFEDLPDEIYNKWSVLKKYRRYLYGDNLLHLEDQLFNIVSKNTGLFSGFGEIRIHYPRREVKIFIAPKGNAAFAYRDAVNNFNDATIAYVSKEVAIIKYRAKYSQDNEMLYNVMPYYDDELKPNMELLDGVKVETPITLWGNNVLTSLIVKKESVFEVHYDVMIEAPVPIVTENINELVIKGDGTLTLIATEDKQPCIGPRSKVNEDGTWEPAKPRPLKKLVIDGVRVVCDGKVSNFAIGKYGYEFVPIIECINGGSIECPEVNGNRTIMKLPNGSVEYNIVL